MVRWVAFLCALFLAAACEPDPLYQNRYRDGGPPPPPPPPPRDAGLIDAGTHDSGEPPPAMELVYIHTGTTLYSWDPATNASTRVGDFVLEGGMLEDVVDIAIDREGRMYGGTRATGSQAPTNRIYQIDPATAVARYRFSYDDTLHGLTFLPDGRLVIAGERVSVVDPVSGSQHLEIPGASAYETSGDIVGLPDGQLYWTVRGERAENGQWGSDIVVVIDPSSGTTNELGEADATRIYGLGYAEGELFGFSSSGLVVSIDPSTGNVLRQRSLPGRWFGATTNPVRWQ